MTLSWSVLSKQLIEDSEAAFEAWREAPNGSYLEGTLAQAITRDLFPSLIQSLKGKQVKSGFEKEDK